MTGQVNAFRVSILAGLLIGCVGRIAAAQSPPLTYTFSAPEPVSHGRFGRDVLIADLDGDAAGEVIVGANGQTVTGALEAGKVYIYPPPLNQVMNPIAVTEPTPGTLDWFGFR